MSAPASSSRSGIDRQALEAAATQLSRSETGRQAARLLCAFLQGAGGNLDSSSQVAVLTILAGAFGPFPETACDILTSASNGNHDWLSDDDL